MRSASSDVTQARTNNHSIRYIFWQENCYVSAPRWTAAGPKSCLLSEEVKTRFTEKEEADESSAHPQVSQPRINIT